ncbi:VOC family protein [Skermania sp. ID1734]|uniref:VOC family protein n=1 Tax=Skermania sp. ID1734 TaxID=2597516 RepID=UPI0011804578|nr:VOC family protein [Skermania sp. ID1734]TSD99760.1 VOC family protein [Skermania sp. ID1734]
MGATDEAFPSPGALPYLTVRGAAAAIDWYVKAFGAQLVGEPITMEDGRIGHAELRLHTGMIYLAEEFPEMGLTAPEAGATSVSLMLPVDDTDLVLARAHDAGGRVERWISENYGRRNATLIDPFGHRWMLSGPIKQQ